MVMYNVAVNRQSGLGTSLVSLGCSSSTSKTCGSMKQLGQWKIRLGFSSTVHFGLGRIFQRKRQKSHRQASGETLPAYAVG